jgi:hypothetical protein
MGKSIHFHATLNFIFYMSSDYAQTFENIILQQTTTFFKIHIEKQKLLHLMVQ